MTAAEVRGALYARHFASSNQMPGPWTCIEEWRNIDFLAFSAWRSQGNYARVGYEVKVSRSDLRSELLNPYKRAANVAWCNEFYLAVPSGLLTAEEVAYKEPEWEDGDFKRAPCPNAPARGEFRGDLSRDPTPCHKGKREQRFIGPLTANESRYYTDRYRRRVTVKCDACNGKGHGGVSRVESEAPTLWVPSDVGLIEVDGRGTTLVKRSPRRKEVPALSAAELGQFVRFVSMRPDPRHAPRRDQHIAAYDRAEQLALEVA